MNRSSIAHEFKAGRDRLVLARLIKNLQRRGAFCALLLLFSPAFAHSQIITIDSHGNTTTSEPGATGSIDRRFAQITPTNVPLSKTRLDSKTRLELIRFLAAEQGFAMRPFPKGHKGLTIEANGKLKPAGESYLSMISNNGTSANPGDRVVLTDVKIEGSKIVFLLNGGPDRKHRILRHIQFGTGTVTRPVMQGDDPDPVGARLTLEFPDYVPEMTGKQVEALIAPLISFNVKTPVEAFTDTLPPKLKDAILNHHVLVGMSTDMVLFAKGRPENKIREMDGQMPFEEWIYGSPPKPVEFVRINGNRVIRVEIAEVGKAPEVFTQDVVEGMMRTDGTPLTAESTPNTHTIHLGDQDRNPDTQAPAPPPSLREPGEAVPKPGPNSGEVMKPVHFPKQKPDTQPDDSSSGQKAGQPSDQTAAPASPTVAPPQTAPPDKPPATDSQPQ